MRPVDIEAEGFITKEGSRQGNVRIRTLFTVVIDEIITEIKNKSRKIYIKVPVCSFAMAL